jgi:hypothetical protein
MDSYKPMPESPGLSVSRTNFESDSVVNIPPAQQPMKDDTFRPPATAVVILVISVVAFATTIAGTATNLFTLDVPGVTAQDTAWERNVCRPTGCVTATLPLDSWNCPALNTRFEAMQGIGIVAVLACLFAMLTAVPDFLGKPLWPPLAITGFAFAWLWVFVQWALIAGTYHRGFCDQLAYSNRYFRMGGSFALYLCLWFLMTGVMVWYAMKRSMTGGL